MVRKMDLKAQKAKRSTIEIPNRIEKLKPPWSKPKRSLLMWEPGFPRPLDLSKPVCFDEHFIDFAKKYRFTDKDMFLLAYYQEVLKKENQH